MRGSDKSDGNLDTTTNRPLGLEIATVGHAAGQRRKMGTYGHQGFLMALVRSRFRFHFSRSSFRRRKGWQNVKKTNTLVAASRARASSLTISRNADGVWAAYQRLIATGEQSLLLTHIAATGSVSLCVRMKS